MVDSWIRFKPTKDIWYYYISYNDCGDKELKERNLPLQEGWECAEIRPFAFIDGKKQMAKFKIIDNEYFIEINKKIPIKRLFFCL
jgi:hypothetical protein